jgi:hypothetical protein
MFGTNVALAGSAARHREDQVEALDRGDDGQEQHDADLGQEKREGDVEEGLPAARAVDVRGS